MRDKNYRRKQEAKHYIHRISFLSKGNLELLKGENLDEKDTRMQRRLLNKLKTGDLKYGLNDKWDKKFSNRTRRQLQKTIDWQLPSNVFLDRKHAHPQVKGYNGDSDVEIWNDLLGPNCGFFEF